MPLPNYAVCSCVALVLCACADAGERAAQSWMQSRVSMARPDPSAGLPDIVDTPPATYSANAIVDPFSLGRIGQSRSEPVQVDSSNRVRLGGYAIDTLRLVGFLEVHGHYVAMVEGGAGYVNVKPGDRISNKELEVVEISAKGIRLRQADGVESWMLISRRSR